MPDHNKRSEWRRRLVECNLHTVNEFVSNVLHSVVDAFHFGTNILYFVVDAVRSLQTFCSSHPSLLLTQFVQPTQCIFNVHPSHQLPQKCFWRTVSQD